MSKGTIVVTDDHVEELDPLIRTQGGTRLINKGEYCHPTKYKIEGKNVQKKMEGTTCGCSRMHRFIIEKLPPLAGDPDPPEKDEPFLVACITCDGATHWPRLGEVGVDLDEMNAEDE